MDDVSGLDLFFSVMSVYLLIAWLYFFIHLIGQTLRSRDLSGAQKAVWAMFLVVFPFIAAIAYLVVRGDKMYQPQADDRTES